MKPTFIITVLMFILHQTRSQSEYFVNPERKLVKWEGWGTNFAWAFNFLGEYNQSVQDEITYSLFSPDRLNLNIVRYLIGTTNPENLICGEYYLGHIPEGFRDGPNEPYNWTRDATTRRILFAAQALGADTFEAVSGSPPPWLTISGCNQGNPEGAPEHENLDPANAPAFAEYLTEVVKFFHENFNVTFSYICPLNYPSGGPWVGSSGSERCNMKATTMAQVLRSVNEALQSKNLTFCSVSAANELSYTQEIETQEALADLGAVAMYLKVSVTRLGNESVNEMGAELSTLANSNNHNVWMSRMSVARSNLSDMVQALGVANRILLDIKDMTTSAWIYWQAFETNDTATRVGFVETPLENPGFEDIHYNSGYYGMMQFSKYIKKGFNIIHVNDKDSIAAYDEESGTLVLVVVNQGTEAVEKVFDLTSFSDLGEVQATRTSPEEPHLPIRPPSLVGNYLEYPFPAKSITTFQITSVRNSRNWLVNGDFEAGVSDEGWVLLGGERSDRGINGNYVRNGKLSGFLDFTESGLTLKQNVTAPGAKRYYISAWCATTGPATKFGVLLNGEPRAEVVINSEKKYYKMYGISVNAQQFDVLSIYIEGEMGNFVAQIDDVEIH